MVVFFVFLQIMDEILVDCRNFSDYYRNFSGFRSNFSDYYHNF
ncbi:hypothetical protein C8K15_11074 [Paenisporosarcina sp. OV554]|nr:hypothetical protein C8K15_11074 [Paenisporosarcina sp. OV554]